MVYTLAFYPKWSDNRKFKIEIGLALLWVSPCLRVSGFITDGFTSRSEANVAS